MSPGQWALAWKGCLNAGIDGTVWSVVYSLILANILSL